MGDIKYCGSMEPWRNLAMAIVQSAVMDYRAVLIEIGKRKMEKKPATVVQLNKLRDLEDFFRSDYYMVLSPNINGEKLMGLVEVQVAEYIAELV